MLFLLCFFFKKEKKQNIIDGLVFYEAFTSDSYKKRWVLGSRYYISRNVSVHFLREPNTIENERALVFKQPNAYYSLSSPVKNPISLDKDSFALQFEARLNPSSKKYNISLKLFNEYNPIALDERTPYILSFGFEYIENLMIQFKFFHKHLTTGETRLLSLKEPYPVPIDELNHVYTLIVRKNQTFSILIDNNEVRNGNFITSFDPPPSGPLDLPDPNHIKPDDWEEKIQYIPDPAAKMPSHYSDSVDYYIPLDKPVGRWLETEKYVHHDNAYSKPEEWDDELFGEYIYPLKINSRCFNSHVSGCGKYYSGFRVNPNHSSQWIHPTIKNPKYKGKWVQRRIPNPNYMVDISPFKFPEVHGIGFQHFSQSCYYSVKNVLLVMNETSIRRFNNETLPQRIERQKKKLIEINKKFMRNNDLHDHFIDPFHHHHHHIHEGKKLGILGQKPKINDIVGFVEILLHRYIAKLFRDQYIMLLVLSLLIPVFICYYCCMQKKY